MDKPVSNAGDQRIQGKLTVKMRFWGGRLVVVLRLVVPLAVASVAAGRLPATMSFKRRSASCDNSPLWLSNRLI